MGVPGTYRVPEYIRLIAQGRYADAYIVNRESNASRHPGHALAASSRTWPAWRLYEACGTAWKRVAADHRGDISDRLPPVPEKKNDVALIGAGPGVARRRQ